MSRNATPAQSLLVGNRSYTNFFAADSTVELGPVPRREARPKTDGIHRDGHRATQSWMVSGARALALLATGAGVALGLQVSFHLLPTNIVVVLITLTIIGAALGSFFFWTVSGLKREVEHNRNVVVDGQNILLRAVKDNTDAVDRLNRAIGMSFQHVADIQQQQTEELRRQRGIVDGRLAEETDWAERSHRTMNKMLEQQANFLPDLAKMIFDNTRATTAAEVETSVLNSSEALATRFTAIEQALAEMTLALSRRKSRARRRPRGPRRATASEAGNVVPMPNKKAFDLGRQVERQRWRRRLGDELP